MSNTRGQRERPLKALPSQSAAVKAGVSGYAGIADQIGIIETDAEQASAKSRVGFGGIGSVVSVEENE